MIFVDLGVIMSKVLLMLAKAFDVKWDESKHPRRANGQFGRGAVQVKSPLRRAAEIIQPKRKPIKLSRKEYASVMSAINTLYHSRYKDKDIGYIANGSYGYLFEIHDFDDYTVIARRKLE